MVYILYTKEYACLTELVACSPPDRSGNAMLHEKRSSEISKLFTGKEKNINLVLGQDKNKIKISLSKTAVLQL